MAIAMKRCTTRVRVRDTPGDDGKATTIKEKLKKIKHITIVYGDFYKLKSNLYLCTNAISVPVLGQAMLDLL